MHSVASDTMHAALHVVLAALQVDAGDFGEIFQQAQDQFQDVHESIEAMRNFHWAMEMDLILLKEAEPQLPSDAVPRSFQASFVDLFAEHMRLIGVCRFKPSPIGLNVAVNQLRNCHPPMSWGRMYCIVGIVVELVRRKIDDLLLIWVPANDRRLSLEDQYLQALHLSVQLPATCTSVRMPVTGPVAVADDVH